MNIARFKAAGGPDQPPGFCGVGLVVGAGGFDPFWPPAWRGPPLLGPGRFVVYGAPNGTKEAQKHRFPSLNGFWSDTLPVLSPRTVISDMSGAKNGQKAIWGGLGRWLPKC